MLLFYFCWGLALLGLLFMGLIKLAEWRKDRRLRRRLQRQSKLKPLDPPRLGAWSTLPMIALLSGCCAGTPGAVAIRRGSAVHLTESEIMQASPLSMESLRQIARNNAEVKE